MFDDEKAPRPNNGGLAQPRRSPVFKDDISHPGWVTRAPLLVTIATITSGPWLMAADETTHTGRRFRPRRSEYGNGARRRSPRSKDVYWAGSALRSS